MNPLGLYDLDRRIRPVGTAYKQLIADWREVLPTKSVCLQVPVIMPGQGGDWATRLHAAASASVQTSPSNSESAGARG